MRTRSFRPGRRIACSARSLHPLNHAEFDPGGRVTEGYTFIQPRVEIAPQAGARSLFTRLYTGDTAIDIYSRAVSDVYQDLFGEGIFTGKGAYDVAAFRRPPKGACPRTSILSHDLFEGLHGRTALASDIVLYEDFPPDFLGYARRSHRWIRGDWQLLPWLGSRVPGAEGAPLPSRFDLLDRWRIADNLRRSLIAPGLVLLAAVGWLALPGPAWLWTLLTIAAPGAYLFTDLVTSLARGRRRGTVRLADCGGSSITPVAGRLPSRSCSTRPPLSVDAIARSLWRTYVSRRRMLEWTTAAQAAHVRVDPARSGYWRAMWVAPALALLLAAASSPCAIRARWPAPRRFWRSGSSRPPSPPGLDGRSLCARDELDASDRAFLRQLARRTWYFFEVFAGPEDNWLPPDNFQADPRPEIAHRTSPTNIGMLLLSMLTARDLGYLGLRNLVIRGRAVLDTMDRMERHRGHWLNWYDTRSLHPLEPRYVSTVDSGNLAVSLVTLAEGLPRTRRQPGLPRGALVGADRCARPSVGGACGPVPARPGTVCGRRWTGSLAVAADLAAAPLPSPAALDGLARRRDRGAEVVASRGAGDVGLRRWTRPGDDPDLARAKRASP
jgi:cyclic beta-1,2-glucan synthetase